MNMNLAETLRQKTEEIIDNRAKVVAIIVDSFQKRVDGGALDTYIEHLLQDKDRLAKRKGEIKCSFWRHNDGGSGTHFRLGGMTWKNPDIDNEYDDANNSYLGISLYDIQADVVSALVKMTTKRLIDLGFEDISKYDDTKPHLGYKTVNVVYHW